MCAINPARKKRIILDVYTSDKDMTTEEFESLVAEQIVQMEISLNSNHQLRWHAKETNQEAD